MNHKKNLVACLLFVGITIGLWRQNKIVKDDLEFSYIVSSPPQRIISLAPNITEILFALDLGKKIVGVTRYCDYPKQALRKEKIGGMVDLSLEKIETLNPDLIIGFRGNPLRILKRIKDLQLPVFVLEMGTNLESIFSIIHKIGIITKEEKKAKILVQTLKKKYYKIQSALGSVQHEPKVFFSLHGMGLWTCGKDSFLDDLVRKAKGVNIAGKIPRKWLLYNREQLIHENPEVIIIISKSQKEFLKTKKWIKKGAHLEGLKAVAKDNIFFLDENMATRPGPRLIDALAELSRLLHPRSFEAEQ